MATKAASLAGTAGNHVGLGLERLDPRRVPTVVVTILTIVIPLVATLWAVALLWREGVGPPELSACALMFVLTFVGVEVGFHRHFAHKSFEAPAAVRFVLAALGSMAFQGSVLWWAGVHRTHHRYADRSEDPHSPLEGLLHAHVAWLFKNLYPADWRRRVPDLYRDPIVRLARRLHYPVAVLGLLLPAFAVGVAMRSWKGAFVGLLWGGLVRVFLVNHIVWSINSICHTFGSRPYDTRDGSRNNAWLAVPSLGFSWHNNHHAFPSSALNSHAWWQFDPCGWAILALGSVGLAWDIRTASGRRVRVHNRPKLVAETIARS